MKAKYIVLLRGQVAQLTQLTRQPSLKPGEEKIKKKGLVTGLVARAENGSY